MQASLEPWGGVHAADVKDIRRYVCAKNEALSTFSEPHVGAHSTHTPGKSIPALRIESFISTCRLRSLPCREIMSGKFAHIQDPVAISFPDLTSSNRYAYIQLSFAAGPLRKPTLSPAISLSTSAIHESVLATQSAEPALQATKNAQSKLVSIFPVSKVSSGN